MRVLLSLAVLLSMMAVECSAETILPDPLEATVLARVERSRQVSWCVLGIGENVWRGEAVVERILEPSIDQGRPQPIPRRFEFESGGWCSNRGKPERNATYVFSYGPVDQWRAYGFMSVETYREFKAKMARTDEEVRRYLARRKPAQP